MNDDESCLLVEDHDAVRVSTLNRPQRRNVIDVELRVMLAESIEAAMASASVRAIVLTGAGGTFCSGGDIATMRRQRAEETRIRAQAAPTYRACHLAWRQACCCGSGWFCYWRRRSAGAGL